MIGEFFVVAGPISFALGFSIGYFSIRLINIYYGAKKIDVESSFMSEYAESEHHKNWHIYFLSSFFGAVNLILFLILFDIMKQLPRFI